MTFRVFTALAIAFLTCVTASYSQVIEGRILDPKGRPVAFASIGIPGTTVGTLSDEDGVYRLDATGRGTKPTDTMKVRAIGYAEFAMPVFAMSKQHSGVITLSPVTHQLPELVVKAGKKRTVVLGNSRYNRNVFCSFTGAEGHYKGTEAAIRAGNRKNRTVRVLDFSFCILKNASADSLPFRLNLYYPDSSGMPGMNALRTPVYFGTKEQNGIVHVDLRKYDIVLEGDFFISLECLSDKMGKENLNFSGSVVGPAYFRVATFSDWTKLALMGLDFNVTAEYTRQ